MNLSKEYIAEQEDCIRRCQEGKDTWRKSIAVKVRHKDIKKFCRNAKTILSVGSAGIEPLEINASQALDVHELAGEYLKEAGWKGIFLVGDCTDMPYLDLQFKVAICQEVIEHLPDLEDVRNTFLELNRVAKRWMATTPSIPGTDPAHKRVFDEKMLQKVLIGIKCKIRKRGRYFYVIHNSP